MYFLLIIFSLIKLFKIKCLGPMVEGSDLTIRC